MLCRPLTVDCSDWDGERSSGGENIRDASHLLFELFDKTRTGLHLLSHINNNRSLACGTRIDPHWEANFSAVTQRALWNGL